jgi:hypothetical protein
MTKIPRACQGVTPRGERCGRKGQEGEIFYKNNSGNVFCEPCMRRIAGTNLNSSFEEVPGVIDTEALTQGGVMRRREVVEPTDDEIARWARENPQLASVYFSADALDD